MHVSPETAALPCGLFLAIGAIDVCTGGAITVPPAPTVWPFGLCRGATEVLSTEFTGADLLEEENAQRHTK